MIRKVLNFKELSPKPFRALAASLFGRNPDVGELGVIERCEIPALTRAIGPSRKNFYRPRKDTNHIYDS